MSQDGRKHFARRPNWCRCKDEPETVAFSTVSERAMERQLRSNPEKQLGFDDGVVA